MIYGVVQCNWFWKEFKSITLNLKTITISKITILSKINLLNKMYSPIESKNVR